MQRIAFVVFFMVLTLPVVARADDNPGETLYKQALQHMRAAPQPAYAKYLVSMDGRNVNLALSTDARGGPTIILSRDKSGSSHLALNAVYRAADGHTAVDMGSGGFRVSSSPFFSATWLGAYDWVRYGLEGSKTPTAAPNAQPTDAPPPDLKVIAVVASMGTGAYRVEDVGPAACPDGTSGHNVHLVARNDPDRHPLTDATIDVKNGGFCMMRFREPFRGLHPVFTGVLEFHFRTERGYSIINDEHMDFLLRRLGAMIDHFALDIRFSDFAFPQKVDPATFQPTPI